MAQAARLNLRLQKELKLLLTDPPPGASFPSLSSSSSSSLSSLDAQIEGPEATVYANGVFKLKIQIPDRYPFQPPIVTFATPIYHPNIDNGGRICLDILNLPPKGAWQPSLNISTVLTSIGLLLSEPNPDDGLMHEVSKEYKYNRQAFDQKARSMTEKYAKPIESENANGDEVNQSILNATSLPMEAKDMDVSTCETNKGIVNNKRICRTNRKLSLELLGPNPKRIRNEEVDEESVNHLAHNQIGTGESEQISQGYQVDTAGLEQIPKPKTSQFHQNHGKLPETEQKSSLKLLSPSEERNNEDSMLPNESSSFRESGSFSRGSSKSLSLQHDVNNLKQHPDQDEAGKPTSDCINASSERLLLADEKMMPLDLSHSMGDGPGKMFTASQQSAFVSSSSMSHQTLSVTQISSHLEKQSHNSPVNGNGNGFTNSSHKKKLGLAGRRLRLGFVGSLQSKLHDNKENLISDPPSNHSVTFSMSMMPEAGEKENNLTTSVPHKILRGITSKQPLKPLEQVQSNDDNTKIKMQSESQAISKSDPLSLSGNSRLDEKLHYEEDHDVKFTDRIKQEGSPVSESIVVLDSEDSEDETEVSARCKFSLTRKRLLQKRKAKV